VTATNLFADPEMRDLVRSGFPASLRYRLELWRVGGLFNDIEDRDEWMLVVQYDPSAQRYRVFRQQGNKIEDLGSFATLATAQTLLERPIRSTVVPARQGSRYYYALSLDVEALSVSDMDQLNRWLRGVRGSTAASAFGNGVRTLMLRMLGGEKKHYEARSGTFAAP
jgi:transcriptional regulator of heat shock response